MKKLFLLFAILVSSSICTFGFFDHPKYRLYSKSDGLNNNTVSAIFQDKEGYLWLGTDLGLTRNDGVNFHHYTFCEQGGSFVSNILQLTDNLLWCWSNSFTAPVCFDIQTGKSISVEGMEESHLQALADFCIIGGRLYALSGSNPVEITFECHTSHISLKETALAVDSPVTRVFQDNKSLYMVQKCNILKYDPATGKQENIPATSFGIHEGAQIENIKVFGEHIMVYGPSMQAVCYNVNTKRYTILKTSDPVIDIEQVDQIRFVYATWNSISVMEFDNHDLTAAQQNTFGLFDAMAPYARILRNSIDEIYYDSKNQVLWAGITGRGVMKIAFRGERIKHIEIPSYIKSVNGLAQDLDGYIWISTDTDGIFRSTTNQLSPKLHFEKWNGCKEERYIQYLDNFGNLWFGNGQGTITQLNPGNNAQKQFKAQYSANGETIAAENINAIYLNTKNRLWVAADNGLFVMDMNSQEYVAYMPIGQKTGKITAIAQDGGGTMWLGTEKGVHMAIKTDAGIELESGFEESVNVAANNVLALYVNNFNQLYVSYDDKTIHIDTKTGKVVDALMLNRDYSSGHIYCITDDGSGCTWLGTASGVVMVNNETLESYLYELQERFLEVYKLKGGELLWATSNGLVYFLPDYIKEWVANRELTVSDLEVNYRTLESNAPHSFKEEIKFKHNENNLHIYVSDMRYGASSSKIEYRLLPKDTLWKSTYGNCIELKDLKQGKYTLELRNPHITSQKPPITQMKFVIKPMWLFSVWGIIISLCSLAVLAVLCYFFILLRLKGNRKLSSLESSLLDKINESRQKEERVLIRSRLRHEIVQKLRTPISLIIAPLKEITSDNSITNDVKIKSNIALLNSVIVQEICTRLEDLFLLEKDETYKIAPYEVGQISNATVFPLREIFNISSVKVYFNKEHRLNEIIWVDSTRISFLLRSLLVHTLQNIMYSGKMWLDIRSEDIDGKKHYIFTIKTEKIAKIQKDRAFDLCKDYEEAINQKLLGWQLLQYIATIHKARVTFKESVQDGLEINLYLPLLDKEYWSTVPNAQIVEPIAIDGDEHAFQSILTNESANISIEDMEEPEEDGQDNRIKLLVIEDNPDIRLYMKVMFSKQYNVLFAEDGEKGIEMALSNIPNLVLTDIMMPNTDGYEVLRILKEDSRTCHIPVVLLTALTGEEDIIKGFDLGADDYITKPFNPEILRAKVRQLVKGRGELKQIYSQLLTSTNDSLEEHVANTVDHQEDPLIAKINELVTANLTNPEFNVKVLAGMLFMSQPTLYRKVKQITGYTIIEVVRTVRLKQAAELLKTKKYSIQEVSELVGYNDVPTFRKHFIALYGTTPSSFGSPTFL